MNTTTTKSANELANRIFVNMMRGKVKEYTSYSISTQYTGLPTFKAYITIEEWKGKKRYFLNYVMDTMPVKNDVSNLDNKELQLCYKLVNDINTELAFNYNF